MHYHFSIARKSRKHSSHSQPHDEFATGLRVYGKLYILELLVFKLREIPQFESFHNQRTALREYCLLRNYQIYVQREANAFDS